MATIYEHSSTITGPLEARKVVGYTKSLSLSERLSLTGLLALVIGTSTAFVIYLLSSINLAGLSLVLVLAVVLLVVLEVIRLLQALTLCLFAFTAKDPIPMQPQNHLRVAVLTTIVPSKEPFGLVAQTLREMKKLDLPPEARVHVWLLDEGNSPAIRARCEAIGVHYFSRGGLEGWNTNAGTYKARTKHGNHNAWRRAHEHRYDIVAQMDPDHVPRRDFLTRTVGYFTDPDVGFVVAPQVYGNLKESWIARAAAFQAYVFHGIIQRGGNGLGAPLLIGTNHLYRVEALRQINGYQDSIIEDHLTSMVLFGAQNKSGKRWKGVYTPDIVAVGEGPSSFTDYFNQQKRWAYGIWEIAMRSTRSCVQKMTKRQAITFLALQYFYPSVAVSWLLSSLTTLLLSITEFTYNGVTAVATLLWIYSVASSLWLFFWLRKFNLVEHERRSWGVGGMALLMMCIPVYVEACIQALARRKLTYAVTAKGDLTSPDNLRTFMPHITWIVFNAAILTVLYASERNLVDSNTFWIFVHIAICALPIGIYLFTRTAHTLRTAVKPLVHSFARLQHATAVTFARGGAYDE